MEYDCQHGCGVCDKNDMRFDGVAGEYGKGLEVWWACGNCGAGHTSVDCCTPIPALKIEPPTTMQEAEKLLEELRP